MKRVLRILASSLPVLGMLLACNNATEITDRCFVNLAPITARTNVIGVGDTVAFHATLGPAECLPAGITTEDWRWSSSDTLTARIDSLSGLALGVSPGDVVIQVQHALSPQVASGAGLEVVGRGH
jgi:uncharacterized protein YjdB